MDEILEIDEKLKKHNQWYPTDADGNIVYNSQARGCGKVDYAPPITMDGKRGSLTRIKEKVYTLEKKKRAKNGNIILGKRPIPVRNVATIKGLLRERPVMKDQESAIGKANHERCLLTKGVNH